VSIFDLAQKIEFERQNNKALEQAMLARLDSLKAATDMLHTQALSYAEHLVKLGNDIAQARAATQQEMADRDEALRAIVGVDETQAGR
jgi:hypothetical protein